MKIAQKKIILIGLLVLVVAAAYFVLTTVFSQSRNSRTNQRNAERIAPVEVATIEQGPIVLRRVFNGTLEAQSEFVIAPKVGGRIEKLTVNISDPVQRGQVVGQLDSAEYVQAVAQAKADLEVARANLVEAENALQIATRELERIKTLRQRGVASESQLDGVNANKLAKDSAVEVAKAQVVRAESALEASRIRLSYTKINAGWSGDDHERVVAERYVDEGETVSANAPLLRIVDIDPIIAVVFVTERDYALLRPGQIATLVTDAFPTENFTARIERIAPVFKQSTRQARVELIVDNAGKRLKPGMFVRATIILDRREDARIIPEKALTRRGDQPGIFLVATDGNSVRWQNVEVGIQDGDRIQIIGESLSGRVVTLGQQMLDDGSAITIPTETAAAGSNAK
ncbi:MAG: efflux RND transporter periplasmic adaptor subunit [Desulfuromonas sp.]|nr:MAG: efflux RND transporter periplasmic adaptor subunit [Desulfuromonas sp.]